MTFCRTLHPWMVLGLMVLHVIITTYVSRSVSCNSSMSKCNKTEDDEEYGAKDEADTDRATQRPLLASDAEFPPPPPPPNGSSLSCSNPDLVQVGADYHCLFLK